jgi:hypothetical protein
VDQRLIDIPLESLPYIDEHSLVVTASPEATWDALVETLFAARGRSAVPVAKALGCEHTERMGPPGRIGSTTAGFVVTRSIRPALLALMGRHNFSRYALIFSITETPLAPVVLSAESRGEFPGRRGSAYRFAVISTRGHVVATRAILHAVRRRAERASRTSGT